MLKRWHNFVNKDAVFIRVCFFISGTLILSALTWGLFQSALDGVGWWVGTVLILLMCSL